MINMKKLIIVSISVIVASSAILYASVSSLRMKTLLAMNLEALASGEDSSDDSNYSCTVTYLCGNSYYNTGSVSCTGKECERGFFSVTCDGHKTSCY